MAAKKTRKKASKTVEKRARVAGKGPYAPAQFIAYDGGGFGLFFGCDAFEKIGAMKLFEEMGAYGNGYGWQSVLAPALEARDPKAARAIEFDSEADTFVARAKTEEPLPALAEVIRGVTADKKTLASAIERRDPD